jgi:hypothetical protein
VGVATAIATSNASTAYRPTSSTTVALVDLALAAVWMLPVVAVAAGLLLTSVFLRIVR